MTSEKLRNYELILISLLVLIMPSLEAAKTLFWFLYLLIYLFRRYQDGKLSLIPHKQANIAVTLFLLATLISTIVNWPFENGLKGFHDEIRYCTLFICLYGAGYTAKEYRQIAILIIVGVLGGLAYGMVEFLLHTRPALQFHSAGVITQSSIYLGITILLNAGLLLKRENDSQKLHNFLKLSLLIQIIALVYMGSRGSMLAVLVSFVFLAVLTLRARIVIAWITGLAVSIVIVSILIQIFPDNVFSKDIFRQYSIERIKESDNQRIVAWKVAFAKLATGKDLVWGIGPRNYKAIQDMDFVRQDAKLMKMHKYTHAHNLFLTQLIEQGLIGLLAMFYLFSVFLLRILHIWRNEPDHSPGWSWYGGIGGLSIPVVAGSFNTPFYQEHAMLAMLVIGMMFALSESASSNRHPLQHES